MFCCFELVAFGGMLIGLEKRRNRFGDGDERRGVIIFILWIVERWLIAEEGGFVDIAWTGEGWVH